MIFERNSLRKKHLGDQDILQELYTEIFKHFFVRKSSFHNFFGSQNCFLNKICCSTTIFGVIESQNVARMLDSGFVSDNLVDPNFFVKYKLFRNKKNAKT